MKDLQLDENLTSSSWRLTTSNQSLIMIELHAWHDYHGRYCRPKLGSLSNEGVNGEENTTN